MPILSVAARQTQSGFTLAELLISLAILGVIATFTIPKILTSQQNAQYNALSKETIATVAAAYQQAQLAGTVTTAAKLQDLTPYMNYVALDTASTVDGFPSGVATLTCSNTSKCLKLHNGALLYFDGNSFADNGGNVVFAVIDPDGRSTGVQDSQGMLLYYTGRVITYGDILGSSFAPTWYTNW